MAREMTAEELAQIRADGQASQLFAAILKPETIFACQVNQTITTTDKVAALVYDSATGDYADVLPGMLVLVGSTAGARDKGVCRVRKAAGATTLYINETSEIAWENDLHLTVVDDFRLHPRHIFTLDNRSIKIDYDVEYSNQHTAFAPVVVMGPHAVAWLVAGSAVVSFDASASWCLSAGDKTYAWTCSAGSFDDDTSATPSLTIDAWSNHILIGCTVTVGGVSSTGWRYVFLFDAEHLPYAIQLGEASGDYEAGGWEFSLTFYDSLAEVEQNALVVLFAKDWYGGIETSQGPIAGRENVIAWGWAATENLTDNQTQGKVDLSVKGPQWWMERINYPVGLEVNDTTAAPASWQTMLGLTVDQALFHLLHWRSTATLCMDVILSGDLRQAPKILTQPDSLWAQVKEIGSKRIFARPCCDRYGRLFVEIDAQMLNSAARASIPVVQTLGRNDWSGELEITRRMPGAAQIDLATIYQANGATNALYSLSPGHIPASQGSTHVIDNYLAGTQSESNEMAGLILALENLPFDFRIQPAANHRLVDICPRQYIGLEIGPNDTPRGVGYSGNALVREVTYNWQESGFLATGWEAEAVSVPVAGIDGDIPLENGTFQSISPMPSGFGTVEMPFLPLDLVGWDGEQEATHDSAPAWAVLLMDSASPTNGVFCTKNFNLLAGPTWFSMNFGLAIDDIESLWGMGVNRAGRVYIHSDTKVWSALLGTQFTLIKDFELDGEEIFAMGVNPLSADSIALIAGKRIPSGYCYFWLGSSGGLSQKDALSNPPAYPVTSGSLSYGVNKWLYTHTYGVLASGRITRFSSAGVEEMTAATDDFGEQLHFHARASTIDLIYHILMNTQYTGGGETALTLGLPAPKEYQPQSVALSPDGVRAIAESTDEQLRKSSDGGATWSLIPIGTIGAYQKYAAVDCADANRWAFAAGFYGVTPGRVYFTPDFGVNWTAKTGNLTEIAGLEFRPTQLKMIG